MDPSTDLIIYVIYFKMFRFFFSLPRSLFGNEILFSFYKGLMSETPQVKVTRELPFYESFGKKKKKNARLLIGRIIFLTCEKRDKCHLIGSSVLRPAWK